MAIAGDKLINLRITSKRAYTSPVRLKRTIKQFPPPPPIIIMTQLNNPSVNQISCELNKRSTRHFHLITILSAAIILISQAANLCHCDTPKNHNNAQGAQFNGISTSVSGAANQHQKLAPHQWPTKSFAPQITQISNPKTAFKLNQNEHTSQKENLLSSVSDEIERQHFKMSPIRLSSFIPHQRPSKFDSGDSNLIVPSKFSLKQPEVKSNTGKVSAKKVDDSMLHIMQMHEQANHHLPIAEPEAPRKTTQSGPLNGLREFIKSPARVASTLINPTTKIVSQVISYIQPLVSSKLSKATGLSLYDNSTERNFTTLLTNHATNSLRARALNTFAGRANNQNNNQPVKLTSQVSSRPLMTSTQAQNLFIPRPETTSRGSSNLFGHQQAFSAQPATSITQIGTDRDRYTIAKPINPPKDDGIKDLMADDSSPNESIVEINPTSSLDTKQQHPAGTQSLSSNAKTRNSPLSSWIKKHTNPQSYLQESLRDLLALSQLPILSGGAISTAPSVLERGGKPLNKTQSFTSSQSLIDQNQGLRAIDELLRLVYLIGTGVRRKRDPLKALSSHSTTYKLANQMANTFGQRSNKDKTTTQFNSLNNKDDNHGSSLLKNPSNLAKYTQTLKSMILAGLPKNAKPRGIMWEMATDPSLAVTVFHLLERASVALPLGFLLMPFVQMIRNPLQGLNLGRILPPRASHRSVDYEELAKRLDIVDKMLSRALRPTHREAFMGGR